MHVIINIQKYMYAIWKWRIEHNTIVVVIFLVKKHGLQIWLN